MNLLLDTHALLWWLDDAPQLSPEARNAVVDPGNKVFVSAASVWEVSIKAALGKLVVPDDFLVAIRADEFVEVPITFNHAHAVGKLPAIHNDPFDRMLIAQAQCESLRLVTRDQAILQYDVPFLLA